MPQQFILESSEKDQLRITDNDAVVQVENVDQAEGGEETPKGKAAATGGHEPCTPNFDDE